MLLFLTLCRLYGLLWCFHRCFKQENVGWEAEKLCGDIRLRIMKWPEQTDRNSYSRLFHKNNCPELHLTTLLLKRPQQRYILVNFIKTHGRLAFKGYKNIMVPISRNVAFLTFVTSAIGYIVTVEWLPEFNLIPKFLGTFSEE